MAGITRDNILKVYNALSKDGTVKEYERLDNAGSKADGAVIESKFTTGASIGDMSWLIYKGRLVSNQAMQDKWTQYREVETSHGFNSRIYVNKGEQQLVITLEGTQPNSDLSPWWNSQMQRWLYGGV